MALLRHTFRLAAALGFLLVAAGCGRRGALSPPLRGIPAAPELEASRVGDELRAVVRQSGLREDGRPVTGIQGVQLEIRGGALQKVESGVIEFGAEAGSDGGGVARFAVPLPPGASDLALTARWRDGRGRLSAASNEIRFSLAKLAESVRTFTARAVPEGLALDFAAATEAGAALKELRLFRIDAGAEKLLATLAPDSRSFLLATHKDGSRHALLMRAVSSTAPLVLSAGLRLETEWHDRFPPAPPASLQAFPGAGGIEFYFPPPADPGARTALLERLDAEGNWQPAVRAAAAEGYLLDAAPPAGIELKYRLLFLDDARIPNRSTPVNAATLWPGADPGVSP